MWKLFKRIFSACNNASRDGIRGNGKIEIEERPVSGFNKIEVSGAVDVTVSLNCEAQVTCVIADNNILPLILTEIRGDVLHITSRGSFSTKTLPRVNVAASQPSEIAVSGSADVDVRDVKQAEISFIASGSGDITATGTVLSLKLRAEGSGDIQCISLVANQLDAKASGSGDIRATAQTTATLKATGSGDLIIWGNPSQVRSTRTGSGDIILP